MTFCILMTFLISSACSFFYFLLDDRRVVLSWIPFNKMIKLNVGLNLIKENILQCTHPYSSECFKVLRVGPLSCHDGGLVSLCEKLPKLGYLFQLKNHENMRIRIYGAFWGFFGEFWGLFQKKEKKVAGVREERIDESGKKIPLQP